MAPIITETSQMIFVAMREEIDVPGLVLLSILEVVDANIRVGDVTHCVLCVWWWSEWEIVKVVLEE